MATTSPRTSEQTRNKKKQNFCELYMAHGCKLVSFSGNTHVQSVCAGLCSVLGWGTSSLSRECPLLPSHLASSPSATYRKAFGSGLGHGSQICSFLVAPSATAMPHLTMSDSSLGPWRSPSSFLSHLSPMQQPESFLKPRQMSAPPAPTPLLPGSLT